MSYIRRVNLFGGPSSGKSTTAAYLFHQLKMREENVELATEYIKTWAYLKRPKRGFDVVYIFAKQLHREDVLLQSGVNIVVTDSPVYLQSFYSDMEGNTTTAGQLEMASQFEAAYPSLNILLDRKGIEFKPEGRYQKNVDEAIEIDNKIEAFLTRTGQHFVRVPSTDRNRLMEVVIQNLYGSTVLAI